MDGLRGCLAEEFTSLYIFNLRGNQRTSGDLSRREGGKIFGSGSRTPVAITLLVKNPDHAGTHRIHYHDIGDYLSRDEKLRLISKFASIDGLTKTKRWKRIKPNPEHDWINQRDPAFESFVPLGDKDDPSSGQIFDSYTQGLLTSRDSWCYNFGSSTLHSSVKRLLETYNKDLDKIEDKLHGLSKDGQKQLVEQEITTDPKRISWSRGLKKRLTQGKRIKHRENASRVSVYRPFAKQWLYYESRLNEYPARIPYLYPTSGCSNLSISVDSRGSTKEFSVLLVNSIFDYELVSKGQCFPLYLYERIEDDGGKLDLEGGGGDEASGGEIIDGYRRRSAISDAIHAKFQDAYPSDDERPGVSKEHIFYYVYGVLHSPEYRERFAADLKKMLPRIPLTGTTQDFWKFSGAGRELAELHLNYETVEPWPEVIVHEAGPMTMDDSELFKVKKMSFGRPSKEGKAEGQRYDKTRIIYNSHVTLTDIPLEAYDYVVNGKSAIEWIMDRYKVTVDKKSGIRNDPNDWCREHEDPRYIVDLIPRLVRVSLATMDIVRSLPALNERTGE